MTPERFQRIKHAYWAVRARPEAERASALTHVCGDDEALRQEVESLLAEGEASAFFATPALARAAPELAEMPTSSLGRRLGPYAITSVLGVGGMGEVYKARDTRLNRTVAIKVLPAHLAGDQQARERFEREAHAVAALNHPHICTLYDVGYQDGFDFLVMEYLEGETLAARVARGPLPIAEAVRYAVQIASALDAAHRAGIVHRDLKPGNVFLVGTGARSTAKLLDFGLAKACAPAAGGEATPFGPDLTTPGIIVGTVSYMAPEQIEGREADARTDIFAFGAVLFEMLTGRQAFEADNQAKVIAAVLERDPRRLASVLPQTPPVVDRLVHRCLAKNPDDRWQSARDVMLELESVDDIRARRGRRLFFETLPRPVARWVAAVGTIALVVTVLVASRVGKTPDLASDPLAGKTRIVVLPFENLTDNRGDDWLASAFSDSLTSGLQDAANLIPVSRDRIVELYQQQGIRESSSVNAAVLKRMSAALGVRYYVHGSYQKMGDRIKVVARLVESGDGTIRAQESVTDHFANLLQLEDNLASRFTEKLEARRRAAASRAETSSLEAYRAVVEARVAYATSGATSEATLPNALPLLQRAIELDPRYAQAWALRGKAKARLTAPATYAGGSLRELREGALADAHRAVELDPSLYEAHIALALAYRATEQALPWRAAAEQAIALNPRVAEAYALLADWESAMPAFGCSRGDDAPRAEAHYRTALRLDPRYSIAWGNLIRHLIWARRVDEALRVADEGLAILPGNVRIRRARNHALVIAGRVAEAEQEIRAMSAPTGPTTLYDRWLLATIALTRGDAVTSSKEFAAVLSAEPDVTYDFQVAVAYFIVNQIDEALQHVDRAVKLSPDCVRFAATTPAFAPYRDTPQFRARLAAWQKR